jgi:hypothetical protein
LKKPVQISPHVLADEYAIATTSRKPKTTTILNVMIALSELKTFPPKISGTSTPRNTPYFRSCSSALPPIARPRR